MKIIFIIITLHFGKWNYTPSSGALLGGAINLTETKDCCENLGHAEVSIASKGKEQQKQERQTPCSIQFWGEITFQEPKATLNAISKIRPTEAHNHARR